MIDECPECRGPTEWVERMHTGLGGLATTGTGVSDRRALADTLDGIRGADLDELDSHAKANRFYNALVRLFNSCATCGRTARVITDTKFFADEFREQGRITGRSQAFAEAARMADEAGKTQRENPGNCRDDLEGLAYNLHQRAKEL